MNRSGMAITVSFVLLAVAIAFGKASASQITIQSATMATPIEITDPRVLSQYSVWAGDTSTNEQQSFIADWAQPLSEPPSHLTRYDVSFYVGDGDTRSLNYSVTYVYDPSSSSGYVYIPGKDDPRWTRNVQTVLHGTEGKWFRSRSTWDSTVTPLLEHPTASDRVKSCYHQ